MDGKYSAMKQTEKHNSIRLSSSSLDGSVFVLLAHFRLFRGSDACAINRHIASTIECAIVGRQRGYFVKSLAVPETCVLMLASEFPWNEHNWADDHPSAPSLREVARGILPSLRYIVERETKNAAGLNVMEPVRFCRRPTTDSYGNDYFCRICNQELPNLFFHCTGCEVLLGRDFDICADCHRDELFRCFRVMNEKTDQAMSDLQHTGAWDKDAASDMCGCDEGLPCTVCCEDEAGEMMSRCKKCSCICHQQFTAKMRFFSLEQLEQMLIECTRFVGDEIPLAEETLARLKQL